MYACMLLCWPANGTVARLVTIFEGFRKVGWDRKIIRCPDNAQFYIGHIKRFLVLNWDECAYIVGTSAVA